MLTELANYWSGKHDVSIITFDDPKNNPFYPLDARISLEHLSTLSNSRNGVVTRVLSIFERTTILRKAIKKLSADVIISFVDITNVYTLLASLGIKIPVIVSERSNPYFLHTNRFYRMLRHFTYKFAQYIIVQTKSAAEFFYRFKLLKSRIVIIPNIARVVPSSYKNRNIKKEIITIGRLSPEKGHSALIKAFAMISNEYNNYNLTIYGEGICRSELENMVMDLGLQDRIYLPGTTKDTWKVLSDASLFILPSKTEGFPNALCEAMAVGLPVVATDCFGSRDIVCHEEDGLLVPIDDINALANAMKRLLNDQELREKLGANAKQVCDRFSEERIYAKWDDLLEVTVSN